MWTRGNKHTQDCKKICDLKYFASPTIDIQKVATSSEDKKLKDASISDIFYSLTNRVLKEAAGPLQKWNQMMYEECVEHCYSQFDEEATQCILTAKNDDEITDCLDSMKKRREEILKEDPIIPRSKESKE